MFFNSNDFKVLEAGVQLTWKEQQLHLQNIANYSTPGYKAKSLRFEEALKAAKEANTLPESIRAEIVEDSALSIRQDGNNVDFEKENIELYRTYTQYAALLNKVKGQFDNYSYVLNSNMK